jgi:hypothetical protein
MEIVVPFSNYGEGQKRFITKFIINKFKIKNYYGFFD